MWSRRRGGGDRSNPTDVEAGAAPSRRQKARTGGASIGSHGIGIRRPGGTGLADRRRAPGDDSTPDVGRHTKYPSSSIARSLRPRSAFWAPLEARCPARARVRARALMRRRPPQLVSPSVRRAFLVCQSVRLPCRACPPIPLHTRGPPTPRPNGQRHRKRKRLAHGALFGASSVARSSAFGPAQVQGLSSIGVGDASRRPQRPSRARAARPADLFLPASRPSGGGPPMRGPSASLARRIFFGVYSEACQIADRSEA